MRNGCLNAAFDGTITAVTSSPDHITFTVHSGSLPTGLTLVSLLGTKTLAITGTPTAVGAYTFVIRATLPDGQYAARQYTINIAAIAQSSLPDGAVGSAYSQTLTVDGPTDVVTTWAITSGSLPAGLSLNASTGAITGTPTTEGDYTFIVCFTNGL